MGAAEDFQAPRLYEVTTDTAAPPAFDRVAKIRQGLANPVHYEPSFGALQSAAYPDIKPLQVRDRLAMSIRPFTMSSGR